MDFQDENLENEQKDDICKQYCEKHKIIFFLCTYPVQISWGLTFLLGVMLTIIFFGDILAGGVFLFLMGIFTGLHEWPWKINISNIIRIEILPKYQIIENKLNYKLYIHLFFAVLYKILGNGILIGIPWSIIGLMVHIYLK